MSTRPRVIVVGAGFGGLTAVRALRHAPVDVLLLDSHNYHTFTPLLYQVASSLLDPSEVAHPVRSLVRPLRNVEARLGTVSRVDLDQRLVWTEHGSLHYDNLILAAGSVTNHFGIEGLQRSGFGLKALDEAMMLRNRILAAFEEAAWVSDPERRRTLLTFAVVGGGPTGVEFAGALTELIRKVLRRDFGRLPVDSARILLLEAGDSLLGTFDSRLRASALEALRARGVEVMLDRQVRAVAEPLIELADGTRIRAGTIIWTAGVKAAPLAAATGSPTGGGGRLAVEPTLQLPGHPEAYAIGDIAFLEVDGHPLPQLIPVAMQEARHAARNLEATLHGDPARPFRYTDPGIMATIGRNAGIAEIGPVRLGGFVGWLLWLGFHLLQVVTFRSRLVVLVNWAWNYVFYDRPVRLLLRARDRDTPPEVK